MLHMHTEAKALSAALAEKAAGARVIWDFDGVVGHTEPLHEASYREFAVRRGHGFVADFFDGLVGHTEQWIWERVISEGFPATNGEVPELHRERGAVVATAALRGLQPSWIASLLMPALGRGLAAFTVGVRHSHNPRAKLSADLTTHL